jgi:tetratricopeptide (TPR) repeat protein
VASSPRIDPSIAAHIDRLATAVAKDPRSKEFLPLADEYIKVDMCQEAAAVLEDGLKAYPGFITAMTTLGRVYDQLAQPVKAKAILEEVVKQRPDNLRAHRILAKLYKSEGNNEMTLQSCTAILNANPYDEEALSLKRSITGAPEEVPPTKRDRKRPAPEAKIETEKLVVAAESLVVAPLKPMPETVAPPSLEPPVLKHAATIARLEAWLRTIQAQRVR